MKGPGKGKTNNPNGRPKGSPNKTTQEAKELLEKILFGQIDGIGEALEQIRKDDPAKYLDACSKFFNYVMPKRTDLTTGDESIKPDLNITVDTSKTAETLQRLRDGGKIN